MLKGIYNYWIVSFSHPLCPLKLSLTIPKVTRVLPTFNNRCISTQFIKANFMFFFSYES